MSSNRQRPSGGTLMDQSSATCSTSSNYGGRRAKPGSGFRGSAGAVPGTGNQQTGNTRRVRPGRTNGNTRYSSDDKKT